MSSLRNAVKRKTHKERAQPARRKKLGLLEKKSDYRVRAKDYHKKEKVLTKLHRKAAERNPDEFYFQMVNKRTRKGVHVIAKEHDSNDVIKLVRSQNAGYLKYKDSVEAKKIEKMQANLHFLDEQRAPNTHTIFLDDEEEALSFDKAAYFETTDAFADRAFNRPTKEALASSAVLVSGDAKAVRRASKARDKAYRELNARVARKDKIRSALDHMELHRNLNGKGRRQKVRDGKDGRPAVYKWKQERKR